MARWSTSRDGADEFVAACDQALRESGGRTRNVFEGMREVLSKTSWDNTARKC